jgi:hypothetical protein
MATSHTRDEPAVTEIIEGPISAVDRVYAFDRIRGICRKAPRTVRRARARLTAHHHPSGESAATAECWLLLEGGLIVCAGVVGSSVRDAVDAVTARLERRLGGAGDDRRAQRISSLPVMAS